MEIFWICLLVIILLVFGLLLTQKDNDLVVKPLFVLICLVLFSICVVILSYSLGVKDGAYNQLREKYEVTYVIDKDSCVVDTIINLE